MTALHIAASFGYKDIVELLIARGADLDAKTAVSKKKLFHVQTWRLISISYRIIARRYIVRHLMVRLK